MTEQDDLSPEAAAALEGIRETRRREAARREVNAAFGSKPNGRDIVQLAPGRVWTDQHDDVHQDIYAVCADGSAWLYSYISTLGNRWSKLPPIPDPDEDN